MKKSGKIFGLISVFMVVLFLAGVLVFSNKMAMASSNIIKWRCQSHHTIAAVPWKPTVLHVIDKIKKRTNGRLVIEPFPAGALVPPKQIFDAVKRGMIEMGTTSSAYIRAQVPLAGFAAGLPFNFKEIWEAEYFYQTLGFEQMIKDACAKHGIYYSSNKLLPQELALKKPVQKMEDFKGLKLRSVGVMQLFFSSIGAAASYIPGGEVYSALATGVVDGAHYGAVNGNASLGFYESCKYHLSLPLAIGGLDPWIVNQKAAENLPEDIREALYAVLKEQFWNRTNQYIYMERAKLAEIQKKYGVEVLTFAPDEFAKLQEAGMKLWDKEAEKSPQCAKAVKMLRDFQKSLGR